MAAKYDIPCDLFTGETPTGLNDPGLAAQLDVCTMAEHSLLLQYTYMLATLPQISREMRLTDATVIRGVAGNLHHLCVQEMAHLAIACNLLVLFGGTPSFRTNLFGPPSDELVMTDHMLAEFMRKWPASSVKFESFELPAPGAPAMELEFGSIPKPQHASEPFALEPVTKESIERLREYEERDFDLDPPKEPRIVPWDSTHAYKIKLPARPEKVGRIYRRVHFELCTRLKEQHLDFIDDPNTMWSPIQETAEFGGGLGADLLPAETAGRYRYHDAVDAIYRVLIQGEGGDLPVQALAGQPPVQGAGGEVVAKGRPHVQLLADIANDVPRLLAIDPREKATNPSRNAATLCDFSRHLVDLNCLAYEVVLAGLYVLWLRDLPLLRRQQFYARLTGFMAVVVARLAALLSLTPESDASKRFLGPTFEVTTKVRIPESASDAIGQVTERAEALLQRMADFAQFGPPPKSAAVERSEYAARIQALRDPVALFRDRVAELTK